MTVYTKGSLKFFLSGDAEDLLVELAVQIGTHNAQSSKCEDELLA